MLKRQQQVPGRRAAISEQVAAALKALERQAVEAGKRKTTVIWHSGKKNTRGKIIAAAHESGTGNFWSWTSCSN